VHNPIHIKDFNLSFPHKTCFENFSTQIAFGDRIGIIGRNGSGKSSLLKMVAEKFTDISMACVPQIVSDIDSLSGGERFNKALSQALSKNPSVLLLDEPTNHLDRHNRQSLMRMLDGYCGTLIVATHDKELLRRCVDILWHIDDGKITTFRGNYDDYLSETRLKHQSISNQIESLEREKKAAHQRLMKEQEHVKKSVASGKKKIATGRWMKSVGDLKGMKAEKSQGRALSAIDEKQKKTFGAIIGNSSSRNHSAEISSFSPKYGRQNNCVDHRRNDRLRGQNHFAKHKSVCRIPGARRHCR
jgi:ATPase subunit of ABC transporter with duplicated ATPase domains